MPADFPYHSAYGYLEQDIFSTLTSFALALTIPASSRPYEPPPGKFVQTGLPSDCLYIDISAGTTITPVCGTHFDIFFS